MERKKAVTVAFRSIAVRVGFSDTALVGLSGKNGFVCNSMMGDYSRVHQDWGYIRNGGTPRLGLHQGWGYTRIGDTAEMMGTAELGVERDCMVQQDWGYRGIVWYSRIK